MFSLPLVVRTAYLVYALVHSILYFRLALGGPVGLCCAVLVYFILNKLPSESNLGATQGFYLLDFCLKSEIFFSATGPRMTVLCPREWRRAQSYALRLVFSPLKALGQPTQLRKIPHLQRKFHIDTSAFAFTAAHQLNHPEQPTALQGMPQPCTSAKHSRPLTRAL